MGEKKNFYLVYKVYVKWYVIVFFLIVLRIIMYWFEILCKYVLYLIYKVYSKRIILFFGVFIYLLIFILCIVIFNIGICFLK